MKSIPSPSAHWLLSILFGLSLGVILFSPLKIIAQIADSVTTTNRSIAELQLEMTNAWRGVEAIVNQPVRAFARTPKIKVSEFKTGWFHDGASKPDFSNVDIRQSQEFISKLVTNKYVSSELNPTMMFLTEELEFNAMTKIFYTNRSLPKRKLSEQEMTEINRLYRIIAKCERAILRIQNPINKSPTDVASETEPVEADQPLAGIRGVPQEKRIFYGAIAAGTLVLIVIGLRLIRKKRG
jgi:hypothetical protein